MQIKLAVNGDDRVHQGGLFFPEQVQGEGVGVVGLEQLALFALQLVFFSLQFFALAFELVGNLLDFAHEHFFQVQPGLSIKRDGIVKPFDRLLHFLYQHGFLFAVVTLSMPPRAGEVGVANAGGGFGVLNEQALSAVSAVNRVFEEMWMLAGAFTAGMACEDILCLLPCCGVG